MLKEDSIISVYQPHFKPSIYEFIIVFALFVVICYMQIKVDPVLDDNVPVSQLKPDAVIYKICAIPDSWRG